MSMMHGNGGVPRLTGSSLLLNSSLAGYQSADTTWVALILPSSMRVSLAACLHKNIHNITISGYSVIIQQLYQVSLYDTM